MRARHSTRGSVIRRSRLDGVSVTDARHGPGAELPLHAHPVACAVLVVEGDFVEVVEGRTFRCRPGDVVLRPADAAHVNRYGPRGARYVVVELPDRSIRRFDGRPGLPEATRVFRSARADEIIRRLRSTGGRRSGDRSRKADGRLLELLADALSRPPSESRTTSVRPTEPPAWLRRARARLADEFRCPPTVAELAADAGVHPDHVSRSFRRHYGFTYTELTRRLRVEDAARAIRTTRRGLARIAFEAGFSDQSHMTRQMKRYLGVTPHRLRLMTRREAP